MKYNKLKIKFSEESWKKIERDYEKWWSNTNDRPLAWISLSNRDSDFDKPLLQTMNQSVFADKEISPDHIAEKIVYDLSTSKWLSDGFPYVNFDFSGPGILSAFLGSEISVNSGRIWFEKTKNADISSINLEYDRTNFWFLRLMEIYQKVVEKVDGQVVLGLPDLGSPLDVLASIRGSEELLLDLYDSPENVKRLCTDINKSWFKFYEQFVEYFKNSCRGISDWSKAYSSRPMYILQSDFSYMLGPEMFEEFALADLKFSIDNIQNSIYHLDGVGQLKHLDILCEIKNLKAIQWIPGDGNPGPEEWTDVIRKIRGSGKSVHMYGNSKSLEKLKNDFGELDNIMIVWNWDLNYQEENDIRRFLYKYGV